jgi:nucleoside-diphosphate-sugar epimerase
MKTIAITGASGFIGHHLVSQLLSSGDNRIKVLLKFAQVQATKSIFPSEVEVVVGDLRDPTSLDDFLEPGCTVINLAYLWSESEAVNLAATDNLLKACKLARVARLIHCSTADVAGRTSDQRVVESSPCLPITEYSVTKLKVEATLLTEDQVYFDVAILRPTAVFGPGGQNLKKLVQDLVQGNHLRNALKACVFGRRRMNLVYVDNVVAAIVFLVAREHKLDKQVFIISDDDAPSNDFASIEFEIIKGLGLRRPRLPRIYFPAWILSLILRSIGQNNVNPFCIYDSGKLRSFGFQRPVPFEEGLSRYIAWHRSVGLVSKEKARR